MPFLPSDVHVNTPLTNYSVAIIQDKAKFIAANAFSAIPVAKQSDIFYKIPPGAFHRREMKRRAPGAPVERANLLTESDTYRCDSFSLGTEVPDETKANADAAINPDFEATEFLTHQALLNREKAFADTFFKASVFTGDQTGVAGAPSSNQFKQWNDETSTPIEDVQRLSTVIHQRTGFRPNTMIVGRPTFDALLNHPDIIDRVKYGQIAGGPAMADLNIMAQLFKVSSFLVGDAIENTGVEGQSDSNAFIFGKAALLCYAGSPGLRSVSAGHMFSWRGMNGTGSTGTRILQRRDDAIRSDVFEIDDYFDYKVISADLGVYLGSAVA